MKIRYATIDIETTGLNRYKDKITWIGVGLAEDEYSDLAYTKIYCATSKSDMNKFRALCEKLRRNKVRTVFQNGKFDTLFLEFIKHVKLPIHEDILLMGTAYDLAAEHKLKLMAQHYLGVPDWDIGKKQKLSGDKEVVVPYLKLDLRHTWDLFRFFKQEMTEQQMKIYRKLLRPAYLAYRDVERNGLYIDLPELKRIKKKYKLLEKEKLAELKKHADINWNSPPQIAELLFDKMGLPVEKRSKKTGKPSADAEVLKSLASKGFELPTKMLEYKDCNTRNNMFLSRWEDDSYESRIHPSFNLTNVVTGRTSCSNPNLQQVPRTKDIRGLFTGRSQEGRVLFEADYSQLELRIAAHYSQDRAMLKVYRENGDIHTETAQMLTNGRAPTKDERNKAKAVNFGFLYGMMAKKFVKYAFMSYGQVFTLSEANRYRDAYFAKYARLLPWHKEMEYLCELQGGVANLFGRFRKLPLIYSDNRFEHLSAARRAINTPVQGTGSDILISAMMQINKELKGEGLTIGATVHDSIIGEFWEKDADWIVPEIRRIMLHPSAMDDFGVELSVPLEVDIGVGPWGTH